jgi:hypothetical protein
MAPPPRRAHRSHAAPRNRGRAVRPRPAASAPRRSLGLGRKDRRRANPHSRLRGPRRGRQVDAGQSLATRSATRAFPRREPRVRVVLLQPGRPRRDGFRRRLIDAALRFFGDPDPAAGSPWDKGERLARRAGGERALLVLDGLEPLQSRHAFDRGKLRDPALASLLCGLARQSEGLCLITTREPQSDLAGLAAVSARGLEQITPEAGRALLRTARVVGTDAELEDLPDGSDRMRWPCPSSVFTSTRTTLVTAQAQHGRWNNCRAMHPSTACSRASSNGSLRAPTWKS